MCKVLTCKTLVKRFWLICFRNFILKLDGNIAFGQSYDVRWIRIPDSKRIKALSFGLKNKKNLFIISTLIPKIIITATII